MIEIFAELPWTREEDRLLVGLCARGLNATDISEAIGRSDTSVRARLQHLRRLGYEVFIRRPRARKPTPEEVYARIGGYQDVVEERRARPAETALPWR